MKNSNDEMKVSINSDPKVDLNNFKNINNYNMAELKKIAKLLSLSLTHTVKGKRKQYRKKELYDVIKKHLKQQHKNL